MVDSFETRDVSTFHLNFFWLLNSVMQKNNIFHGFRLVLCILIYFHTRIQTFTWTVIKTVFLYFIFFFIDLWTVTYFFLNMCTILGNLFWSFSNQTTWKKIISDILKAFTCMNKNITSIIHVWNDKRTGHIYVPIPYLTHPPPLLKKKPLSYPIQMKPTNIKQYCQPIFIRDDSISIKWCVTDFFFVFFSLSTLVLFKHPYGKDCFAARNIYDCKALAILANNSCTRIKVVVQ